MWVPAQTSVPEEGGAGLARLWEWVVDQGAANAPVGVSKTRHRAMEALSRTLIAAEIPASGRVVPMALVEGAHGFTYLRMEPEITADCEKGVIRWHGTSV